MPFPLPCENPRIPRFLKFVLVSFLLIECFALIPCTLFPGQQIQRAYSDTLPNARVQIAPRLRPAKPTAIAERAAMAQNFPPLDFPSNTAGLPQILADDLDRHSLVRVIKNYLSVLQGQELHQTVSLGPLTISLGRLKATFEEFLDLLNHNLGPEEFTRRVKEAFFIYPAGGSEKKRVVFTGYYTPIIPASRFKREGYNYPLYQMPKNLTKVKSVYRQRLPDGDYAVLRLSEDGPNFTRRDIDGHRVLKSRNLEIAWLKNDMERYFLQIQGSGVLEYLNGTREGVQYVGSNGYSYTGIGQLMRRDGILLPFWSSMQGIKQYFEDHPQDIQKYLFQNKRYVFFELTNSKPQGSSGAEVVAGRSIATDPIFYPQGALGFIAARKPMLNNRDEITGWKKFSRFVVNQDTGSAIKGPGRVDLYFGVGNRAGAAAGRYMEKGRMFFLIKK